MKIKNLKPEYVEHLPDQLAEGVLYICEDFELTAHKCCCGCGEDVITKLGHAKWELIKNQNTVSLYPSIGNWNYKCQSHYWIRKNRVLDAGMMSEKEISYIQEKDRRERYAYIESIKEEKGLMTGVSKIWKRIREFIDSKIGRK